MDPDDALMALSPRDGEVTLRTEDILQVRLSMYLLIYASIPLWYRTTMNPDVSTGTLTRPFLCSLTPLTHSLALHYSLCLHSLVRLLIRSLAHSLIPELVGSVLAVIFFCSGP